MVRTLFAALILFAFPVSAAVFHPAIAWSTFLAGAANHASIALDARGNIYLFTNLDSSQDGTTPVPPCPAAPCRDETPTRKNDLYVAKLTPDGSRILWQRFIGGAGEDFANSISVSPEGDVFLSGVTISLDFPVTKNSLPVVFQPTDPNQTAAYLMRLDTNGETRYSTLIDGSVNSMLADANGEVLIAGYSKSPLLAPTPGALALEDDRFISRLSADGTRILMSLHGVSGLLTRDGAGNLIVAGTGGPINPTPGAFQTTAKPSLCGGFILFPCGHQSVSKVSADGSKLLFSTYVSGYSDATEAVAVDADGNIVVVGATQTDDYPVTPGALQTKFRSTVPIGPHGGSNAYNGFITKLSADGRSLIWSTFLGGRGADSVTDVKVGADGTVYVAANLTVFDFPELDSLGKCPGGPVVAAIRADGAAVVSARILPVASGTIGNPFTGGVLALDQNGSIVFSTAPARRGFPVSPQVVSSNPDPARITDGVMIARIDLSRAGTAAEAACTVDGADLTPRPAVAPGELITFFAASGLGAPAPTVAVPASGKYPTSVAGTQVLFDGIPAPLLYTASDQINAVAPYEIAGRSATVITVLQDGIPVQKRVSAVVPRAPTFLMPGGSFPTTCSISGNNFGGTPIVGGVILNPDGTLNSCSTPAHGGDVLEMYVTGLGAVSTAPPNGVVTPDPPPAFPLPIRVQINGTDAPFESLTGAAGWISGVWKLRVKVPVDSRSNIERITAIVDGAVSQQSFFAWVDR